MKRKDVKKRRKRPVPTQKSSVTTAYMRKIIVIAMAVCIGLFSLLGWRLGYLMIGKHKEYEALAIANQTRSTSVTASRGSLYDRNMTTLAASASVENIFLDPLQLEQNKVDIDFLARNLALILDLEEVCS